MKIAFAGFFAIRLAEMVRANLSIPHEAVEGDETAILPSLRSYWDACSSQSLALIGQAGSGLLALGS